MKRRPDRPIHQYETYGSADVYQIATNCRTSVKMIEDFFASHIKHMIDASVVNVRRTKPKSTVKPTAGKTLEKAKRPRKFGRIRYRKTSLA